VQEVLCSVTYSHSRWLLWPHVNLQPTQRWASPYGSTEDGSGPLSPLGARPPSANMSVSSPLQAHSAASMGRTPANRDGGHSAVQTPQQVRSVPPMLSGSLSLSLSQSCVRGGPVFVLTDSHCTASADARRRHEWKWVPQSTRNTCVPNKNTQLQPPERHRQCE
jgi:hypothetical protein